jgi:translocation and assembly module TamB
MSGALTITDGAFTDLSSGVSIVDIDGEATARSDARGSSIEFEFDGAGPGQTAKALNAKGAISFVDGPVLDSRIVFQQLRLSAGPVQLVEATGDITVSGSLSQLQATGAADVTRLDAELFEPEEAGLVDIDVAMQGAGPALAAARFARRPSSIRYALRIAADENINISGRGLESEWKAEAAIDSVGDRPLVLGRLELIDGHVRLGGRRIQLTRGLIEFDRLAANDPALDIRAERRTSPGPQVSIMVGGRASAPDIKIEAAPAMPQEDAMALLLFDKPMSDLTALQSLQVADSLSELGGVGLIGGKGIAAAARSALGLDLLDVSIDETNSAASLLTVGKYVTDGLFVSASQDARGEAGSVTIEYKINDSFSIETELRQDGDQTISANWKKDF